MRGQRAVELPGDQPRTHMGVLALGLPPSVGAKFAVNTQVALSVKSPPASAGDTRCRFSHRVGRSPGAAHGNPPQYSRLQSPADRGA